MIDPVRQIDKGETMEEMWKGFYGITMPHVKPNSQQYLDMKGAFFAGALCFFHNLMEHISDDKEATSMDLNHIEKLDKEITCLLYTSDAADD